MARNRYDQPRPGEGEPSPAFPMDEMPLFFDEEADFDACDCFAPPAETCECYCLHCGRVFLSDQIWFQRVVHAEDGFTGFWMCPTPNCDGRGFTFDIFPTDPAHPANADVIDDEATDEGAEDWGESLWDDPTAEYDPDEPQYSAMEEFFMDDIEGEEWKYGLQPGESLPESELQARTRQEWQEHQRRFDEPDERPREIDASEMRPYPDEDAYEDDLPF